MFSQQRVFQGRNHKGPRYTSLIHGENLINVTIQGEGMNSIIDGQGEYWWTLQNSNYTRGHLLELMYTENIVVCVYVFFSPLVSIIFFLFQ